MERGLKEGEAKRYKEDAVLVIKMLNDGRIKLKHGELNPIGVRILVKTMSDLVDEKSVNEIAGSIDG